MKNKLLSTAQYIVLISNLSAYKYCQMFNSKYLKEFKTFPEKLIEVKYKRIIKYTEFVNQTAPRPEMFISIPNNNGRKIFPKFKLQQLYSDPVGGPIFIINDNKYEISFTSTTCFFKDILTGEVNKLTTIEDLARHTKGNLAMEKI